MQLTLELPERNQAPLPSWGGSHNVYTMEYAESYIAGLELTIQKHRNTKTSTHMNTYWNDAINYYSEWIQVLNGTTAQDQWEKKWKPKIDKYAKINLQKSAK